MKIENLRLVNFMGIRGVREFKPEHIIALCGKNGAGKTTVLNAIRYGLTGAEPDGDIIHAECDECRVEISLTDPVDGKLIAFERIKNRTKASKFKVDGAATTQKSMNEKIEQIIGIDLEKIKVLSSSEVVAAMKPQEFASFILDYIPEKIDLEKVLGFLPDATIGMVNIISANLPEENISIDTLDEFEDVMKATRKEHKASLASKKSYLAELPDERPVKTREEVEAELKSLESIEAEERIYKANKDAYDKAVDARNRQRELIQKLQYERDSISAVKPNPVEIDTLRNEIKSLEESLVNQRSVITNVESALTQLKITREALEKPICPISPLITCHQDKTVAKEEIQESIDSTEEGIKTLTAEIAKLEASIAEKRAALEEKERACIEYDKKISLSKQIKALEDGMIEVPAEPVAPKTFDVSTAKASLTATLKQIQLYEEGLKLKANIETMEAELKDLEALVKAFSEKGQVRCGVIDSYLSIFEEICNERSTKFRPDTTFKFVNDNGVVVLMKNDKGNYLSYDNLSGGEKAYMLFILIDMLNSLCGTRLLVLDELSVLDGMTFDSLLDLLGAYGEDYDHIIIAAVDHPDTVESLTKRDIPVFLPGIE